MHDVDAVAVSLLPRKIVDCGVHAAPNRSIAPLEREGSSEWPGRDCVAGALKRRVAFVARYLGNTMDSSTETVLLSNRHGVYRIYKDTAGPFIREHCSYADASVSDQFGVACAAWGQATDLRAKPRS
jgi:hypothetical protein